MAHGSDAARDLRYGRRGGGWQTSTARDALDALAAHRARYPHLWPNEHGRTDAGDDRACRTCDDLGRPRRVLDHRLGPCPICGTPLEHHVHQQPTDTEWAGRARMAAARQAAGLDLDPTDHAALERHPNS